MAMACGIRRKTFSALEHYWQFDDVGTHVCKLLSKKLFGCGGAHFGQVWGAKMVRVDTRVRGYDGWRGAHFGWVWRVAGTEGREQGPWWGAWPAFAGWAGARGASALAGQECRAGRWRFGRDRPEPYGWPSGGCAERRGTKGSRRSRDVIRLTTR